MFNSPFQVPLIDCAETCEVENKMYNVKNKKLAKQSIKVAFSFINRVKKIDLIIVVFDVNLMVYSKIQCVHNIICFEKT